LAYTFGVTVSPNPVWEDSAVTFVYGTVAHGLANKMIGECPSFQVVSCQDFFPSGNIIGLGKCTINIEVVTPAGDFETVESPFAGQLAYGFKG
jgi:hypothetical protein